MKNRNLMGALSGAFIAALLSTSALSEPLKLNDKGYFETRGVNFLVFSNWYDGLFSDSKISGVELIQQGKRIATNGDVRLMPTPGQWDEIGQIIDRKIDKANNSIIVTLKYPDYDFTYQIKAVTFGENLEVSIILGKPLPAKLEGRAGFNLEFLPSAYFHKSYIADGKGDTFPIYPSSDMKSLGEGNRKSRLIPQTEPVALAEASSFVLAPEDGAKRVAIKSLDGSKISLFDGRNQAQNGWFVLHGKLPSAKTGAVLKWQIEGNTKSNWVRPPMIAHSQLGYVTNANKVAVIETDPNDKPPKTAQLEEISVDGSFKPVLTAEAKNWGKYLRYNYSKFDFSSVKKPGLYVISYGNQRTSPFKISDDIYENAWHPTQDVYMPVQMDHMQVNEAYRVWHGDSHKDDALQAPINEDHIDLYGSKDTTDTKFKPFEHIPGLNVGGWFDAGDFDIRTQTHYATVRSFVSVWEKFKLTRDTTTIDENLRMVEIHVPDGKPDTLQQIKHGVIQLVAQFDAVGHAINGIVEPDLAQYPHLGDAVTKTDGLIYDPSLKWGEVSGNRSGRTDDRWAFTNKSSSLNYGSIAALAASSRALKGFDDALATKSLDIAKRVWAEEQSHPPIIYRHGNTTGGDILSEELSADVELLVTTGEAKYAARIQELWPQIEPKFAMHARLITQALPYMPEGFKDTVRKAVIKYKNDNEKIANINPFGVPITEGGWAGNGTIINYALTTASLHNAFPDIIKSDAVFKGLDYIYGTHPDSNISFVSGVGTVSKEVAYGNNRADFSFISGGIVPGVLILKPDFPENHEDWPFFWGQNEYVINLAPSYIELVNEANALSKKLKSGQ